MNDIQQFADQPTDVEQAQGVWSACLELAKERVNTQSFKTWFEPIKPLKLEAGRLTIEVPSQFFYDWLEEHYYTLINAIITRVLGHGARLEYSVCRNGVGVEDDQHVVPAISEDADQHKFPPQPASFTIRNTAAAKSGRRANDFQNFLNPRYTFENFIKGESNQLARAAASAVANNPGGTSFNPLVIYGGTGLGKTHLIQAIGNHVLAHHRGHRVIYVSS